MASTRTDPKSRSLNIEVECRDGARDEVEHSSLQRRDRDIKDDACVGDVMYMCKAHEKYGLYRRGMKNDGAEQQDLTMSSAHDYGRQTLREMYL